MKRQGKFLKTLKVVTLALVAMSSAHVLAKDFDADDHNGAAKGAQKVKLDPARVAVTEEETRSVKFYRVTEKDTVTREETGGKKVVINVASELRRLFKLSPQQRESAADMKSMEMLLARVVGRAPIKVATARDANEDPGSVAFWHRWRWGGWGCCGGWGGGWGWPAFGFGGFGGFGFGGFGGFARGFALGGAFGFPWLGGIGGAFGMW